MMQQYQELRLGPQANAYITEWLENGKTLSSHVLALIDLQAGESTTWLPDEVNLSKAQHFEYGGISSGETTLLHLVKEIQAFLSADPRNICIFEDAIAQREDEWIASTNLPVVFGGDDVYYLLSAQDRSDVEQIKRTIAAAESPVALGVMTSFPMDQRIVTRGQAMSVSEITELTARVTAIVVSAYDGEGFVIWRRD